jgi:predicted nucleic acid-binding protein
MPAAIVDTGPLVAFFDRAEQNHRWVTERVAELDPPLLVCEPVLAEAMHLLARFSTAQNALFGLLENGAVKIAFRVEEHIPVLRKLHQKYRNRPMSLADAWRRTRMAEIYERHAVLTSTLISRSTANMAESHFFCSHSSVGEVLDRSTTPSVE